MALEPDRLTGAPALDRVISAAPESKQEEAFERALRPKALDEYIGQERSGPLRKTMIQGL